MNGSHLSRMILDQCKKYGEREALASKSGDSWKKISWRDMASSIEGAGMALIASGIRQGDSVAIFSPNRPEWAIADYAIMSAGACTVPIYATSSPEQAEYIINDASVRIVFVGGRAQLDAVLKIIGKSRHLEKIVVFDHDALNAGTEKAVRFDDFIRSASPLTWYRELQSRLDAAGGDDVATIIYTSGTTGEPKGAILTHANFFSEFRCLDEGFPMDDKNVALCFLPLSHAYEKCSDYWVQTHGASIYYCDDPSRIIEYFQEVRPTYMVGVPRLYEKMYGAIYDKLEQASPLKKKLFNSSVAVGKEYNLRRLRGEFISPLLRLRYVLAYSLVLKKIRGLLGGRLNFFSAGGAPLSHTIEEFFVSAAIFIGQGYGLTETAPCIAANNPGRFKFGSVGPLFSCNRVRIAEDGEILVRGENVTRGYHNKPEQTRAAFMEDGWFKTGDIGFVDEEGFLFITDRKKDIIVTAGGKNVAPQMIESCLGSDFYVEQVLSIGDRRKFISALVVPAFDALEDYARRSGISFAGREELVKRPEIIEFYARRFEDAMAGFSHAEKVKKFTLLPKGFTIDDGEITPTMKIKRKVVEERYRDIIDAMYAE